MVKALFEINLYVILKKNLLNTFNKLCYKMRFIWSLVVSQSEKCNLKSPKYKKGNPKGNSEKTFEKWKRYKSGT